MGVSVEDMVDITEGAAVLTVWDKYHGERDPSPGLRLSADRDGDILLEFLEDDCTYLTPRSARLLATGLEAFATAMDQG